VVGGCRWLDPAVESSFTIPGSCGRGARRGGRGHGMTHWVGRPTGDGDGGLARAVGQERRACSVGGSQPNMPTAGRRPRLHLDAVTVVVTPRCSTHPAIPPSRHPATALFHPLISPAVRAAKVTSHMPARASPSSAPRAPVSALAGGSLSASSPKPPRRALDVAPVPPPTPGAFTAGRCMRPAFV